MYKTFVLEDKNPANFGHNIKSPIKLVRSMEGRGATRKLAIWTARIRFIEVQVESVEGYLFVVLGCKSTVAVSFLGCQHLKIPHTFA